MRSLLGIDSLSSDEFQQLITRGMQLSNSNTNQIKPRDEILLTYYEKDSLRTRVSTERAGYLLGLQTIDLPPNNVGIGAREPISHFVRFAKEYNSILAMRVKDHSLLKEIADFEMVNVINLLSDKEHPLQAIADFIAMAQNLGSLNDLCGKKLCYVGEGNNVSTSLMFGCALTGVEFVHVGVLGYEMEKDSVDWALNIGGNYSFSTELFEEISDADFIYTDTWYSMGDEDSKEEKEKIFSHLQINESLIPHTKLDTKFMHCGPIHLGSEMVEEIVLSQNSLVFNQKKARLYSAMSVIEWLLNLGEKSNG